MYQLLLILSNLIFVCQIIVLQYQLFIMLNNKYTIKHIDIFSCHRKETTILRLTRRNSRSF